MKRYPDWAARLKEYIAKVHALRFRPGTFDCALFAAGAVKAMTGEDLAAKYGSYRTLEEGRAMLKSLGFASHVDLAAEILPEIHPMRAAPGDVAVIDDGGNLSLGIVQGPYVYALTLDGVGITPLTDAKRAFRV